MLLKQIKSLKINSAIKWKFSLILYAAILFFYFKDF